jgi:hypothetical protein
MIMKIDNKIKDNIIEGITMVKIQLERAGMDINKKMVKVIHNINFIYKNNSIKIFCFLL